LGIFSDDLPEPLDDLVILVIDALVDRVELPILHVNLVQAIEDNFKFCDREIFHVSLVDQVVEIEHERVEQNLLGFVAKPFCDALGPLLLVFVRDLHILSIGDEIHHLHLSVDVLAHSKDLSKLIINRDLILQHIRDRTVNMLVIREQILQPQLLSQQPFRDRMIEIHGHWDPLQHGLGTDLAKERHQIYLLLRGGFFGLKFIENVIGVSHLEDAQRWVHDLVGNNVDPLAEEAPGIVDFFFVYKLDFELLSEVDG